jgi:cobalt-zinc-cadmium efflux system membrane fusion protein
VAKFKEKGDWCAEHGFPESACPTCNPMTPPGKRRDEEAAAATEAPFEEGTVIRLKKSDHERVAGIETTTVKRTPVGIGVRAPARVEFDRNRVADVRAPFAGIVKEVLVDLGDNVEKGERLFVLESAEIGDLQAQIRSARQRIETARSNHERQQRLQAQGIASMRKVEEAQQRLNEAESRLQSLRSSLRLAGAGSSTSSGRFTLRAPIAGTVVRRPAVVGTSADESAPLARIADSAEMWGIVDVSEQDAAVVELGQPVSLTVESVPGKTYHGEVLWVSPEVDPRTRTVDVRAAVDNPDGKLRANQFAEAEIGIAADRNSVVVPRDALQRLDDVFVVFIRESEGVYEPRVVEVVRRSGDLVQLGGGVEPGEQVVSTGAFLLRTELKRDAIGAGCCEVPGE